MTSNSPAGDLIFDHLVACDPLVGHANMPVDEYNTDINDLANEMRRLRIAKAIVRSDDCRDVANYFCNEMLMQEAADQAGILPAWFLTPDGRGSDYNIADVIKKMLAGNVRIAWTDPCVNRHYGLKYAFRTWCCGGMLEALQSHAIPLLLSYDDIDLSDLHEIMTDFPKLRVILLNLPRLGRQTVIEALLKNIPNFIFVSVRHFQFTAVTRICASVTAITAGCGGWAIRKRKAGPPLPGWFIPD